MLETLDLSLSLPKPEYLARLATVQRRLLELQTACWQHGVGSVLVFEGWDADGAGACVNLLTERLEPRGFRLHAIQAPRTYETHMPWLWRFWRRLPEYGQMGIFDKSWYRRVLDERVDKEIGRRTWEKAYQDIVGLERGLADDGYVIRKFFFHISKKEQKKRIEKDGADPLGAWNLQPEWRDRHRKYEEYLVAAEEMLARTDSEWAPWTLVEATDRRWARIKVFDVIAASLETALRARGVD